MKVRYWIFTCLFSMLSASGLGVENANPIKRIVSINLCTDQLLYLLADKKEIASVSFLAADSNYSYLAQEMSDFILNNANIEEIIPLQPDLVLAGTYTESHTLHFLRDLGFRVEQISIPQDMQHIEQGISQLANLLGKEEKAKTIITDMHRRRTAAIEKVRGKPKPLAIILAPDGFTHGKGSMNDELLQMAGYRNLAAESGINNYGNITLETLIEKQPDFLIIEDSLHQENSLAQRLLQHPALSRGLPHVQQIYVHPNLLTCGGPSMIDALEILVAAHP